MLKIVFKKLLKSTKTFFIVRIKALFFENQHKIQDTNMKRIVTLTETEHDLIETVRNYRRSFVSS